MKNLLLTLLLPFSGILLAQNQAPQISNLTLDIIGGETLMIQYDLFDLENDEVAISLHVKKSDGTTFSINTQNATGEIGLVVPGTGKSIEWNFTGLLTVPADYIIKLVAEDTGLIDIQSIVNQVDSNNLKSDLAFIEGIRHRNAGPNHLQATRDLIEERFIDYGLSNTVQSFAFGTYTGENYIGTKAGTTDDEFIYICDAHYDSVSSSPGADDNGSGVVGFLEAARILSNYNFKKTIKFIGFDLEETGLNGSQAYVTENISAEEQIAGVLNLEMIGYYTEMPNTQSFPFGFNLLYPDEYALIENDSFRGNFVANIGVVDQNDWELAFDNAAALYVPELKVVTFAAPQNWPAIAPDLGRSDHAPFWLAGHPAVMLTGTSEFRNAHYHSPNDTLGTLNFTFMSNIVKATVATLAEQAEIHNSSFVEETISITVTSTTESVPCHFMVSPNPVNDLLSIKLSNCNINDSIISIYELNGKPIFEQKITGINKDFRINTKKWASGVYVLKLGQTTKKFIVQH